MSPYKSKGLQHAEDYEYSPGLLGLIFDNLPGFKGKRAYDRVKEYEKNVHFNPEDSEKEWELKKRSSDVYGKSQSALREEDDKTVLNRFQNRSLVSATENPRLYGYQNVLEEDDKTKINQYIFGTHAGHAVEEDDEGSYAVDPYNITKSESGGSFFGVPYGYSGSIKKNPGIDPYINKEYFTKQLDRMGLYQ